MTSAHLLPCYLHRTENWLHHRLLGLRRYQPIVFAMERANEQEFSLPCIRSFGSLSLWRRAFYRLPIGPFEAKLRSSNFYYREMSRAQCRILHSHFAPMAQNFESLRRHARKTLNCATITSFYGYDLMHLAAGDCKVDTTLLFQEETGFVVEGKHMAERLAAAGCPPEKIHVNALGIELSLFPEKKDAEHSGEFRILTVGRFIEKKGIIDAIHAVVMARQRSGTQIRLTIVGDGVLRPLIESTISNMQAGSFVDLVGSIEYSELIKSYYKHDILLQPSVTASDGDTEGGAPVSIIEGMAAGLPIVATRHADIPNVVQEGQNALLVDEHQTQQLANALCELICDTKLRQRFAQYSRRRATEFFDSSKQSKALEIIYDALRNNV